MRMPTAWPMTLRECRAWLRFSRSRALPRAMAAWAAKVQRSPLPRGDVVGGCRVQVQPIEGALVVEVELDRELRAQSELDGCGNVAGPAWVVMDPGSHDHMRLAQRVHAGSLAQAVLVVQLMDEVSGGGPGLNLCAVVQGGDPHLVERGTEARATSTIACSDRLANVRSRVMRGLSG